MDIINDKNEAGEYIAELLGGLRQISIAAKASTLTYFIEVAINAAEEVADKGSKSGAKSKKKTDETKTDNTK